MKHRDIQNIHYNEIVQGLDQGINFLDFSKVYLTKGQINDLAERVASNPFVGHIIWGPLPNESKELVEQIENKLIENNKQYKSHPNDFIHGLLSEHSYQTSKIGDKVKFSIDNSQDTCRSNTKYNQSLEDWRVEKVFQPENADNYYSVLYVNEKTHHAVLAHRGTDIAGFIRGQSNSVKADLKEILNHNIGVQQAASYVSTKEALDISKSLGYNFSTTGHSLGAWLAELTLYFCHIDFQYPQVKAVTFDSPGSKDQMDVLAPNVHNINTKIITKQFDIVTYLSAPNIINICNQHIGTVYTLAPEIKYLDFLKRELFSSLPTQFVKNIITKNEHYLDVLLSVSGHALRPMLAVFDPKTGKPYSDKHALVLDWPHLKHVIPSPSPIQKLLKGILLHNIPIINSLPNSWLKLEGSFVSVTTFLANFLIGDNNILQLCKTFKHFDLNTHDEGYLLKDLPQLDQFTLSHEGHYKTQTVDLLQTRFKPTFGSIDWYLSQIYYDTDSSICEKQLDELSYKQLSIVKNGFKIQMNPEDIAQSNILLISDITQQHNITSIRELKEYLLRLVKVNPTIKKFLEYKVMQQSDSKIVQHNELKIDNEDKISVLNASEEAISNPQAAAHKLYRQACHYDSQRDYKLALQYYQNALLQSEDALPLVKGQLLYSIACKYDQLNQTELALANYLESLKIYNSENNNHIQIAPISYSIGAKYDELRDNKLALKYYNDALSAYQKLNSPQSSQKVAEILYSIGAKYDDNIDSQKALQYYCKSLKEFCSAKNNTKTIELLSVIEQKFKDLNNLDLGLKCQEQLKILQVAQKLSLADNIEQKNRVATEIQPILKKIGSLTKEGFWNKGFFTSYSTPFYNYGVKGYIDKNYILNQLGPNSNDEDFEIAKILCFEKICIAISENIKSEKSLNCLLEFAKVYPETIKAVQATMFCNPENFPELKVALDLINNELFSVHQDTQMTSPLVLIPMDILFHIDKLAEPNEIMMGKEMCSEENIL